MVTNSVQKKITAHVWSYAYVVIVAVMFMVIAATLGMQLFAGQMTGEITFDSFPMALLAVFVIMMGDSWSNLLQNTQQGIFAWLAPIYFPAVYIASHCTMLVGC